MKIATLDKDPSRKQILSPAAGLVQLFHSQVVSTEPAGFDFLARLRNHKTLRPGFIW